MRREQTRKDPLLAWLTDFDSPTAVEARQRIAPRTPPLPSARVRRMLTYGVLALTALTLTLAFVT